MSETTGNQIGLDETTAESNPLKLFERWFDQAQHAGLVLAESMALATASKEGRPSVRMVLLKQFDDRGFVFYTNYRSSKARDLADNPQAALVFHWAPIELQVRIEGTVERTSKEDSDTYFRTRPRESQIGALASPQSEVIPNREVLERKAEELARLYGDGPIERPEHWGGYVLRPERIEFWKGRVGRLHDRLLYERQPDESWIIKRLAP